RRSDRSCIRAARRSWRRPANRSWSAARKATASGVRISSERWPSGPVISIALMVDGLWMGWSWSGAVPELRRFGRADECEGLAVRIERGGDPVEVASADLALVARGRVSVLLGRELCFLQFHVGGHVSPRVVPRERVHRVVQSVEPGKGDELEGIAHRGQLALEGGDLRIVQVALPV